MVLLPTTRSLTLTRMAGRRGFLALILGTGLTTHNHHLLLQQTLRRLIAAAIINTRILPV